MHIPWVSVGFEFNNDIFFDIGGPDQVIKVRSRSRSANDQMLYSYTVLLLCVCLSERTSLGAEYLDNGWR